MWLPHSMRSNPNTKNTIASASSAIVSAPTRRASTVSDASRLTLLLPEELPRITFEIADQLAQIAVQLVAREQRAGRSLAGTQVRDHAVDVIDETACLASGGRGLVCGVERLVEALLG